MVVNNFTNINNTNNHLWPQQYSSFVGPAIKIETDILVRSMGPITESEMVSDSAVIQQWFSMYNVTVRVMVFNAACNNISVISWRSVLFEEEIIFITNRCKTYSIPVVFYHSDSLSLLLSHTLCTINRLL